MSGERPAKKAYKPEGYTEADRRSDTSFLLGVNYGRSVALREAADFIEVTAGIGSNRTDYANGWYAALDYVLAELRSRAADPA